MSTKPDQAHAPSQRPELSDARRRPLWPHRNGPGGPSPHAPGRLCCPSRAVRARATPSRDNAHGGLDQSAADPHQPGGPSHDHRHPGRPTAKLHAPATTHRQSPGHARHQRGVATVNAESGCLKVVDTARGGMFSPVYRKSSSTGRPLHTSKKNGPTSGGAANSFAPPPPAGRIRGNCRSTARTPTCHGQPGRRCRCHPRHHQSCAEGQQPPDSFQRPGRP